MATIYHKFGTYVTSSVLHDNLIELLLCPLQIPNICNNVYLPPQTPLEIPTENLEELPLSRRKEVAKKFNWNHGGTLAWEYVGMATTHVCVCVLVMYQCKL